MFTAPVYRDAMGNTTEAYCETQVSSTSSDDSHMDPDAQSVVNQLHLGTQVDPLPLVPEQLGTEAEPLVAQFEDDRDSEAFVTAQGLVVEEVKEEEAKVRVKVARYTLLVPYFLVCSGGAGRVSCCMHPTISTATSQARRDQALLENNMLVMQWTRSRARAPDAGSMYDPVNTAEIPRVNAHRRSPRGSPKILLQTSERAAKVLKAQELILAQDARPLTLHCP
jgi:hypothetical protein